MKDLPLVLYGAGGAAAYELSKVKVMGYNPVCFVDVNPDKWAKEYLGLPILSLEQAQDKYGDFDLWVTAVLPLRVKIFEYLITKNAKTIRILNYPTRHNEDNM